MSLLDRLRRRARPTPAPPVATTMTIEARRLPAGSLLSIVGESHYQPGITAANARALGAPAPLEWLEDFALDVANDEPDLCWFDVWLCREPDNPYDGNAIAVWSLHTGDLADRLGYLSREDAIAYGPVFEILGEWGYKGAVVPAFARFGGPRAHPGGVVLALSRPDFCVRTLRKAKEKRDAELDRLNQELERLAELDPDERERMRERLAYEARVFGSEWSEIARELGYDDEAAAIAAAEAHSAGPGSAP